MANFAGCDQDVNVSLESKLFPKIEKGVRLNDGPDIKLFILVGLGRSFFVCCLAHRGSTVGFLLLQWCCSTPQGSLGVGRNTFLSSPHLCFIIGFI